MSVGIMIVWGVFTVVGFLASVAVGLDSLK